MTASFDEAMPRIPTHRMKILQALRDAGEQGVTNAELQRISQRWSARIGEMYVQGYVIDNVCISNGLYKYTLLEEPKIIKNYKVKASEIIFAEIEKQGNVTAEQLRELLEQKYMNITRRYGSHKVIPKEKDSD